MMHYKCQATEHRTHGAHGTWPHLYCRLVSMHIQAGQHSTDGCAAKHLPTKHMAQSRRIVRRAATHCGIPSEALFAHTLEKSRHEASTFVVGMSHVLCMKCRVFECQHMS
jgi:hypothetical protein